jgi:amidase
LVGVCYLPSTVAPTGLTADGLPVGVQVVGPHLSDARTLRFAGWLGELMGGFRRPPGY